MSASILHTKSMKSCDKILIVENVIRVVAGGVTEEVLDCVRKETKTPFRTRGILKASLESFLVSFGEESRLT